MSLLAELLKTKYSPATPATQQTESSKSSKSSKSSRGVTQLPADFERRYRAMATRWRYTDDELSDGLEASRQDLPKALRCVVADEQLKASMI